MEKLRHVVTDSIGVSDQEIHDAFVRTNEKFVIRYVLFEPSDYEQAVAVSDAVLREYYENNTSLYQIPEQRRATILLLDREKAREAATVTDAEKQRFYQENLDNYRQQERVSVKHILLRATEADPEGLEAARAKAADLVERLKGGANFEQLATENSDDTASAANGGDLGWIVRGQTVANFEAAAFSLEPGTLSEPIQTEYGIHVLKVAAHEAARVRPFEEVETEIENTLLDEKVQATLAASAEQAAADWRRESADLTELAERYHGTVLTPPPYSRGDAIEGVPGSEALAEDSFILDASEIGRPVSISSGFAIPRLEEIIPARVPDFAEVREEVRTAYVAEQSRQLAHAKAMDLAQTLEQQENRDLTQQARAMDLTSQTTEPLTRSGSIPSVGSVRELGPRLETIQPGEIAGPVPVSGGHVVFQVDSREPPNEEDFEAQRSAIRQQLLSFKQNTAFASFQESLKTRMMESGDVQIDRAALERLNSLAVQ
jgi:peptidyl-prolyl cis-trans isomerase D